MKAWVLERHGSPERSFALRDQPDPHPGPGQVLIRSEGFGLNYADVMAVRGLYRDAPAPPCVLGYETVGRVERCGKGVPEDLLGKRVTGMTRFGGYAELAITDHRAVAIISEDMGIGEACALATQGCTAWYMTHFSTALRSGQRVLIHSAAGGVGHLLVMIAVRRGCEVFAIGSGQEKMILLRELGAHHLIDRSQGDYTTGVQAALKGERIDISFNAVGGSSYKKDVRLIGSGGAIALYGGAERSEGKGPFGTLRFVWSMGVTLPILLMMKSRSLIGVNMLRISEAKPDLLAQCLRELVAAHAEGWLRPHVHGTYDHLELVEAHKALMGGRTMGKVAVRW